MGAFRGFVIKEFFHIFRDRRTLVILFGMPVVQLMLFGFAIRNEVEGVSLGIVTHEVTPAVRDIVSRLEASRYFRPEYLASESDLDEAFRGGKVKAVVVFPLGFEEALVLTGASKLQAVTDASEPNTASTVLAYLRGVVRSYQADLFLRSGTDPPPVIRLEPRMRFNPQLRSVVLFVPGLIALILMLVCALMTSITITREKEVGTMEVLLVSPLRPAQIIVGKVMPYLALSVVNVVSIMVLAAFVFRIPFRGSVVLLLVECLLFIVCALSMGILISTRTSSQQTAMMISLAGLLLPTVILSGFIFPIESMPEPLQVVSHVVPAKWFLIIIRGIMVKGVGLEVVWPQTMVLLGMTTVFLAAAVRNFAVRLDP